MIKKKTDFTFKKDGPKQKEDVLDNLRKFSRSPGFFKIEWIDDAIKEIERLRGGVIESRDSVQIGQTGSAHAKPENSDMDFVCHDIVSPLNDSSRIVSELRSAISDGAADWKLGELTRSLLSA